MNYSPGQNLTLFRGIKGSKVNFLYVHWHRLQYSLPVPYILFCGGKNALDSWYKHMKYLGRFTVICGFQVWKQKAFKNVSQCFKFCKASITKCRLPFHTRKLEADMQCKVSMVSCIIKWINCQLRHSAAKVKACLLKVHACSIVSYFFFS